MNNNNLYNIIIIKIIIKYKILYLIYQEINSLFNFVTKL